jgi:hypothetical protein
MAFLLVIFSVVFDMTPLGGPIKHKETQGQLGCFLASDWEHM